nr:MAG TPA: hypothetical protein [Caudoviricetes sp.]
MPPSHILVFILLVHIVYLSFYIEGCKIFFTKKKRNERIKRSP